MNRGEIRWYTFRSPDKRRPMLILSRSSAVSFLPGITVAPLTTIIREIPTEVLLTPDNDGVPEECVVNLDNLQTIQKAQMGRLIATLSTSRMAEVEAALCFALGMDGKLWQA